MNQAAHPRVSIVMPMFNSAAYLESTVASVVAQTFTAWELILFDDGSTDETPKIAARLAASDPRIRTAKGRHAGVGAARNDGLRLTDARAEFVVFLDSDDTWVPEALSALVAALDADPASPAAHALAQGTDMDGQPLEGDDLADWMRSRQAWRDGQMVDVPVDRPTPFEAMIIKNWVVTPGTSILRRSALDRIGDLDPATSPADDWDINVRLSRLGPLAFVDQIVLNWRRHPDSLANTSKRWRWAVFAVRKKSIADPTNSPEQRRAALALLAQDCRGWRSATIEALRARKPKAVAAEATFLVLGHAQYVKLRARRR